jgi:5-methyltetrahydrofolate--homocysteine methyltransferase
VRNLLDRLKAGDVVVGDGAWGTLLMARGLKPGEPPESINLMKGDSLEDIAHQYLAAGAEIVTTNTFGGSPARLRQYGLDGETEAINRAAVEAARRAAANRAYVSASVGPCGHVLAPYGDANPADVAAGFERQIRALFTAGVDLICIETMTDLHEATLAVRAARDAAPGVPIMATMTFELTRRGFFTVMGVSIEQAARGLADAGADIVGSNCGNGSEIMIDIARAFRASTDRPIAIQANAGLPEQQGATLVYRETPDFMAEQAGALLELGVSLIGGCCGTTPDHIRAIRRLVDRGSTARERR